MRQRLQNSGSMRTHRKSVSWSCMFLGTTMKSGRQNSELLEYTDRPPSFFPSPCSILIKYKWLHPANFFTSLIPFLTTAPIPHSCCSYSSHRPYSLLVFSLFLPSSTIYGEELLFSKIYFFRYNHCLIPFSLLKEGFLLDFNELSCNIHWYCSFLLQITEWSSSRTIVKSWETLVALEHLNSELLQSLPSCPSFFPKVF